ncbi:MAG TPA: hypothetical protein VNZ44_02600 [Pyrinomonadaceae bacterium]|nr:hypothetical protein [Pyrinomonadaceae bacterium]
MSPLKGILVAGLRSASRRAALCTACLLLFAAAARTAKAAGEANVIRDADARRAEKVLAKLRLLHADADAGDFDAYRSLASKLFPDLFVKVSEISACDLGTDLSTAVFLAERLARTSAAAGDAAADCRAERPDIYAPLCLSLRGGTARQLLLAKSRLHARWAEASLKDYRGETDAETARTLSEMRAARANDVLIAARVLETLRPLEGLLGRSEVGARRGGRLATATADGADNPDEELDEALGVAGALLTWLPRGQAFYQLSAARQAYADGLSWYRKARPSKLLVISAQSFAPDPLKALRLDAEQAAAAATANWKSAAKFTRLTEQTLSAAAR